jgi:hypothetical protein
MMDNQEYSETERAASYVKKLAEANYGPLDELTAKALQLNLLEGIEDCQEDGE